MEGGGGSGTSLEPSSNNSNATFRCPLPSSFPPQHPSFAAPSGLADPDRAKAELYLKSYV